MSFLKWLGLFVALAIGFFANQIIDQTTASDIAVEYCYLSSKDCEQENVHMQLALDDTRPMQPNRLTITWPSMEQKKLTLTLRGLEMEMGIVKIPLEFIGNQTYQADLVLPICAQSQMTWIGELSDGVLTVNPAIRAQQ